MELFLYKFLENESLMIIGLILFSFWSIRSHLKDFKRSIFWNDNKIFLFWAFGIQTIFSILLAWKPEAGEALGTLTAIDYNNPMAFLYSGHALSAAANATIAKRDKIGKLKE